MSIVCTVCRDPLTSNPVPGSEADWDGHRCSSLVARIVVTGCGHAQHEYCLTNWIQRSQSCPFCSATVSTADFRRIFPIGDEDIEEAPSSASGELAELRRQNVEKDKELTKLRQSVEKEQTEATKLRRALEEEQRRVKKLLRAAKEDEEELTNLLRDLKKKRLIADVLRVDNACLESKNLELTTKLATECTRTAELDVQVADCQRQISTLKRQLKAAVEENAATAKKISLLHKHSPQAHCLLDQLLDTNKHYRPNSTEITEPHDDGDVTDIDLGDTSTSCHYIPTPRKTTRLGVEEITVNDNDDAESNHDSSSSYFDVETTSSSSIAED